MEYKIRPMNEHDKPEIKAMMRTFYSSDAVLTNGSEEIFDADIEGCIGDCPFLEGYTFEDTGNILGYAMIAKSFSTEFGKSCIWIEDLYLKKDYQGYGIGSAFLRFIEESNPNSILRLEVENDNERAVHVYKKCGFEILPYMEMKK